MSKFSDKIKSFPPFRFIGKIWQKLINIGVYEEMLDWKKKRTRLLNGISVMMILLYSVFMAGYTDFENPTVFIESLQAFVFYFIPIILNYFRKNSLACHAFSVYNLFCYAFFAFSHGDVDAAEYILIGCCVFPLLFFRDQRIIYTYLVLNIVFFFLAKYSFFVSEPFLFMPDGENLYISNTVSLFVYLFLVMYYFKSINSKQENQLALKNLSIQEAKEKTDELLLNILPHETAEELKEYGFAKSKRYDDVTVLFTDFEGFAELAEALTPERLVAEINEYFSEFDKIITKYGIEKIKTIGDSYMCAGGLTGENKATPSDVVRAGLEIQHYVTERMKLKSAANEPYFKARLGIHTGSVVAGIVGVKKFAYDIWGDTVNTASRMESNGEVGKVNISGSTYNLVKDDFNCTYRGKIEAKGKGEIDMYFVVPKTGN